ncbi:MAG: outer membrane beta-barrel protein [Bacteroidota bacterium]
MKFIVVIACLMFCIQTYAQTRNVMGVIKDTKTGLPVQFSSVAIHRATDSVLVGGRVCDENGSFNIELSEEGTYYLKISFMGYETLKTAAFSISANEFQKKFGTVLLKPSITSLKTVTIETQQIRVEQKGDTTQFNANAYKTNPDATAEDLIRKMPGVTSDGTAVKVNGEEVKKVLVDGKPFFGDDPAASLKNFPADIIDKVQVFDKSSDQAQFTGFKDGNEEKTINLITKSGKNAGQFGKVYGGYGTDNRYNGGLTFNSFNGARRISVIGMANNINQQNFNISDIMGVMSNSGVKNGGMGGGPGGPENSGAANFYSGQQSGITGTTALGINYVDSWSKKTNVSGGYFFNQTNNTNTSTSVRNYFTDNKLIYNQSNTSKTDNLNHKINLKFEYAIDSSNSLIITPRLTIQKNNNSSILTGNTKLPEDTNFINQTGNTTSASNAGYNFLNDILLQHKFHKKGRTVSANINTQINDRDGYGDYYSSSIYNDTFTGSTIINQHYTSNINGTVIGGNLSYTEPVGTKGQIQLAYRPEYTQNVAGKITKNRDSNGEYTLLDSSLSNEYTTSYTIQRGGINYLINNKKINLNIGTDIQQSILNSKQIYPADYKLERTSVNILPSAILNYKFSKSKNLNITFRSSTKSPSVNQLQNVLDVSNPLLVKTGNVDLKQTYENNLRIRLGLMNPEKARNFFVFLMANQTNDYISNATYLINTDTLLQGYTISKGSQLTTPLNLNGYYSIRSFGVYSFPLRAIKSNFNFNAGYTYTHTPALINDEINYSGNHAMNSGIYLSSNISQSLDFSIAYSGSYNTVRNSLQVQSDNSYFNHTATLKVNYILLKKVVFNTDINQTYYSGLTKSYNQNFILWNAYIGYKFLKNQALEAKVSVYDIMNQNKSISRTITETYTEDSNTQVLKRYLMFTLTYTFKHFKTGSSAPAEQNDFPKGLPPPGTMPPPGGIPPPGN